MEEIDSALQSALSDPRERVALLKLETILVEFLQTADADWIEVGGPWNSYVQAPVASLRKITNSSNYKAATSFQKCLVHRLADRFQIARENSKEMEWAIRLLKTPNSKIPSLLLQNISVPKNRSTPKQIKIIKRSDTSSSSRGSHHHSSSDKKHGTTTNHRSSSASIDEKEKAYAEARARIFANEKEIAPERSTWMTDTTTSNDKAVWRNRAEEAADPDFQRQSYNYPHIPIDTSTTAITSTTTDYYNFPPLYSPNKSNATALTASAPEFKPRSVAPPAMQGETETGVSPEPPR